MRAPPATPGRVRPTSGTGKAPMRLPEADEADNTSSADNADSTDNANADNDLGGDVDKAAMGLPGVEETADNADAASDGMVPFAVSCSCTLSPLPVVTGFHVQTTLITMMRLTRCSNRRSKLQPVTRAPPPT